jgi:hypothetical protein
MGEISPLPGSRLPLFLLAIAIGILTTAADVGTSSIVAGHHLDAGGAYASYLMQVAMIAAPFLLLALLNVRARGPWLLAFALTVSIWGYALYDGLRYQPSGDRSGPNIGLGLLLFASPILISLVCLVTGLLSRRRPS